MEKHLSREQLLKYRDRALLPAELIEVDGHLASCDSCLTQLTELGSSGISTLSSIFEARDEHLTYEQMDAWVEGTMDSDERELVMSHIGLCEFCAEQLKGYEKYAPVMSAVITPPAQPAPTLGERIRGFFRTPQFALITAGLAVLLILSPLAFRRSPQSGVPAALQPEAIRDLPQTRDKGLIYPVSEVVEERQPILQWKATTGETTVYLYDSAHREIIHSPAMAENHWLVPVVLDRGAVYNWEVRTAVETKQASFRVLSESSEKELAEARSSNAGPRAVGQLEQGMGLLSLAEQDFAKLVKEDPGSKDARDLLDQVKRLRDR